jgi:hypothetical protein
VEKSVLVSKKELIIEDEKKKVLRLFVFSYVKVPARHKLVQRSWNSQCVRKMCVREREGESLLQTDKPTNLQQQYYYSIPLLHYTLTLTDEEETTTTTAFASLSHLSIFIHSVAVCFIRFKTHHHHHYFFYL